YSLSRSRTHSKLASSSGSPDSRTHRAMALVASINRGPETWESRRASEGWGSLMSCLSRGLAAVRPGVERVAQAVAEEVEREDRDHDHGAGEDRDVRRAAQVAPPLVEHGAPLGRGRLRAQPEEAEVRGREDRRGHAERDLDDDRRQGV